MSLVKIPTREEVVLLRQRVERTLRYLKDADGFDAAPQVNIRINDAIKELEKIDQSLDLSPKPFTAFEILEVDQH